LKSRTLRQAICDIQMEYSLEQMARSLVESGDYRVTSRLEPQAVYHYKGQRWYGNTTPGAFVCRREADQAGDRASKQ